ncbi:hypothetical protein A3D83_04305 [Candidatus Daviesbacteria bacterium RIFCSPHIGHO2_02_FULL_41_10]|uniref:Peptidase C39 domain-containing protein n=2 Tax=Candidatus Daviesiibacteriota TaxID=1752718 RepID=A0A1F5IR55_9BACT|nr:MAG: hypothetical protein A2871_02435 [Candidatus Daviesbacteria bacterium RIFCSPHIGHO2_01_FULL_41_23]OGE33773.1 MAG: hypothetical protein A3D83_04305 [Candidatus Daviesbacteria bacterium RIFCSPHIGHO2_02_FULL_41_10]OGE62040.1 MAG: hypothetical protein A2967_00050 [Candidatus Daviesbacteria bacterium RIFCSPLOWO2_01_FULL_41_32]
MIWVILSAILMSLLTAVFYLGSNTNRPLVSPKVSSFQSTPLPTPSPTPMFTLAPSPTAKIISQKIQVFQTFNNCGPAALSMALSYFGINESQQKLGLDLRPFQNPQGDNDDKSVTLDELAKKAQEYGLLTYHRPGGSIEQIKLFISYDIPVIVRTWLKQGNDIGHYRLIRGFDDTSGQIIQDDSLQGASLKYSYNDFTKLWQGFNYEYLVLVPRGKQKIAEAILGESLNGKKAWEKSLATAQKELESDPGNIFIQFNISVAYYYLGDYQNVVETFEIVEEKLPFRLLWYQIEPILAYQKLKDYDRVFELSDKILNTYNRAFSELYQIRGEIYQEQGKEDLAQAEFEKVYFYNKNFKPT